MGNLQKDTRVVGGNGRYVVELSPEWDFWAPNGGYLSAIALSAAAAETDLPRPASYYCQYLKPAISGEEAEIVVTTLRRSKQTHAMRAVMSQDGKAILEALIWTFVPNDVIEHDYAKMPEVPEPESLRTNDEIHAPQKAPFRFWANIEGRPVTWTKRWEERPRMDPLWRVWNRFRPQAAFDDAFVDAARSVILIDALGYQAAAAAHEGAIPFIAPSMALSVHFHEPGHDSEWLLSSTESPIGFGGLIGGSAAVWSKDGRLLATGGQQMTCRPVGR
jgi:acyl-CoA thioesterase II